LNENSLAAPAFAQPWSLNVGEAGTILVLSGLVLFIIAALLSAFSVRVPVLAKFNGWAFGLASLCLFSAFGCLATLFAKDQFQFSYVYSHGDAFTALSYKIAGVWSGQQGSFLLWACTSAIFGLLTFKGSGKYRPAYLGFYSLFLATLCGILAYETPFGVIKEAIQGGRVFIPPSGNGLAPSLMNYWVIIHPPTIFLGFGSLTVLFAYTIAAIIHRNLSDWISQVRPWTLVSLAILGLGICMGGFWAYETLGWGGFWGWDPVENASFIPWIFVAAFTHGIIVQAGKKRWHGMNLILGALPFLTFCYGTFLTRGGFLDKVSNHSFASMQKSALVILEYFLGTVVLGFVALYLWKGRNLAKELDQKTEDAGLHRESLYGTGVLFLCLLGAVMTLGISWPLIAAAMNKGQTARIEEGAYHLVVAWFFIPIMLVMAVTPFIGWRSMGVSAIVARVGNVFCAAIGLTGLILLGLKFPDWGTSVSSTNRVAMPFNTHIPAVPWIGFLLILCMFTFVGNTWRAVEMFRKSKSSIGGFVAHLGLATLLGGLILSRGLEQQERVLARQGTPEKVLGYTLNVGSFQGKTLYDRDGKLPIQVTTPSGTGFTATPGLYYQQASDPDGAPQPMVWPYIRHYAAHDFYLSLGPPIITLWEKPETFHVGESKVLQGITVKYKGLKVEGTPGTSSAVFAADVMVTTEDGVQEVTPSFGVGNGAQFARINRDLQIVMPRMNAADKSVDLQVYFTSPIYPIEVFTKPLTGLVWGGTGILTLGGFLAAFSRRKAKARAKAAERTTEPDPEPLRTDAPIPAS